MMGVAAMGIVCKRRPSAHKFACHRIKEKEEDEEEERIGK